ncbi:MAG: 6-phospho-3-hexuloisomerase [Halobacteriota archaeon]|nr:6-phospho-3-hexuloisomerase [Halobacteriota archaeon]
MSEENATCSSVITCIRSIVNHIGRTADQLDQSSIEDIIKRLRETDKIFVMGAGRSGLVARAFAMRLMHLGFTVFVVGDSTTPAVGKGDMVMIISGSGETFSMCSLAKIAKDLGAVLVAVTSNPDSTLGELADVVVVVKGRTKSDSEQDEDYLERQIRGDYRSLALAPLGTMFEITSLVVLDAIVAGLMTVMGKSEADLKSRHATLE